MCAGVAAGIGWIDGWREKGYCRYRRIDMEREGEEGTEGGNHSAIRALSLGPVFITVQLL